MCAYTHSYAENFRKTLFAHVRALPPLLSGLRFVGVFYVKTHTWYMCFRNYGYVCACLLFVLTIMFWCVVNCIHLALRASNTDI